ncbi:endonuclease/exonuclease/phosphatase family protein [Tissierella sp.]|uniref:endonuclease/exonuclease/phosphatase family protein n=1 Tax=Tissierella sp. TaxID=41274 RepID=UPI0028A6D29A|nr:endonuclease/exonuclease/phosphatase family protein [Tissierella sp.]
MIRLQLKLSGEALALFDLYAKKILDDSAVSQGPINKGYLLQRALDEIPLEKLNWEKARDYRTKELKISSNGMQTALMLEKESIEELEKLRVGFREVFKTQRIYRPFVIKLIIKAAILKLEGSISKVMKWDENKSMKLIQQNINFENQNILPIIEIINKKEPEVIFFQEYKQSLHSEIEKLKDKYKFYYPKGYEDKHSEFMLCLLAVKKGVKFEARKREGISLYLRYIEGKIIINNFELEIFLIHVPQTSYNTQKNRWLSKDIEYYQDRVEYKGECLFEAYRFSEEYKMRNAFIGGDFNVDIRKNENGLYKKNTRFQAMFKSLYDNGFYDVSDDSPTWKEYKYDYALVTESLQKNSKSQIIETTSDHKMIITEIIYSV